MTIRAAQPADLDAIRQIQRESPEAAQWDAESYLQYDCRVVEESGKVIAFAATRKLVEDESELLNLAVSPAHRRSGAARKLLQNILCNPSGISWFLEVRESNLAARKLYEGFGFTTIGRRPNLYEFPSEAGIVMRLQK